MNLLEALKTGGVFRRPHDKFWWGVHKETGYIVPANERAATDFEILPVTLANLLATDWQVREELTCTYDQFYAALNGSVPPEGVGKAWKLLLAEVHK